MQDNHRCGHLDATRQGAACGDGGRQPPAARSGRHHRVRAAWHMDRCPSCGLIHRGRYDGYRGDVLVPRTSSYLTANRLSPPRTAGLVPGRSWGRIDVNSVVLLAGVVLLLAGPPVGWLFLG